ncbi:MULTISPECIES: cyclic nucleotide-binding domain-containing protein [Moorena]|nr:MULTISPECIES: cyclic nucleotide-binding domain-containing protein [Moorena]NEP32773.1 cyclic nucleotide-binding domain-containing protein [Moorena sp. SIO3B2]NEP69129.1 cyclic nucleotide-binding domain-containing protein [Moorena sp. SIO3A5]
MIPISTGMVITQDLRKELETIEIDNKYEDCLFMKLEGTIVQPDKIDLFLTINFHDQFLELPGGSIKLGLTGGELRLNLTNGKLPYYHRGFNDDFKVSIEKKRRSKQGSKIHHDNKMSMGLDPTSHQIEFNLGTELNLRRDINHEKTDEFTIMDYQITSKGGETNPAWVFAAKSGEPLLTGTLSSIWLGSKEIPAGHVLIHEGESINALYIVLDGILTVSVEAWKSREIARLSNGEVVGEMSFVKDHPPSATVKALEDSIVWSIDRAKLTHKLEKDPRFAARFYRLLAAAIADRIHLTTISLLYFEKEYQIEDPMATHLKIDELTTSSQYRFMATPIHNESIKTYEKVILDKTKAALLINGVIES